MTRAWSDPRHEQAIARRGALAVAALALIVAACGGAPVATSPVPTATSAPAAPSVAPTPAPTTQAPVALTVGFSTGLNWSAFYVGVEKGLFLKNGVDLRIKVVGSVQETGKAQMAGEIQVAASNWTPTVSAISGGIPLRVIGLLSGRPDVVVWDTQLAMIAAPGFAGQSVADLKGKRVAATFGGAGEDYARSVLKKGGVDPDKDVKLSNSSQSNMLSLIQTNAVEAVSASEPFGSNILRQVQGSRLLQRGGGSADTRTMVTALDSWIKANPAVVDRFMAGLLESQQYARQHPDETATASSRYISGVDVATLTAALKNIPMDPRWSNMVMQGLDQSTQALVAAGTLKNPPKTQDVLVLDLLSSYEKKYPQFFSDLK